MGVVHDGHRDCVFVRWCRSFVDESGGTDYFGDAFIVCVVCHSTVAESCHTSCISHLLFANIVRANS